MSVRNADDRILAQARRNEGPQIARHQCDAIGAGFDNQNGRVKRIVNARRSVLACRVSAHLVADRRRDIDAGNPSSIFGGAERHAKQHNAEEAHLNTIIALKLAMTSNSVLIRGDGVAARCCGHLLSHAGYRVSFEPSGRPRVPLIMLSDAAQNLIRDIFQRDDLFRNLPVIRKRIVAWGSDPVELDHSAVVVSEEQLLASLGMVSCEAQQGWTICAAPPLPAETVDHRFGSRMASAVKVELKTTARSDACWIESLDDGWLFLNSGWLIAVGAHPEELLQASRLVSEQIETCGDPVARFAASPRMITPAGADRWISCGSAAMSFDPLCGDGTAHAVREAILASAVIRAADRGEEVEALLSHYEARLTAGFQRHLTHCREFYFSGGSGEWWKKEAEACIEGIQWCESRTHRTFQYRLENLELRKI